MVLRCVYCGIGKTKGHFKSLHRFPIRNEKLCDAWVRNLEQKLPNFKAFKYAALCSDHFEDSCFKTGTSCLVAGSVPTIFRHYKNACVYCNSNKLSHSSRTFHRFPLENKKKLNKWLTNMNLENFEPNSKSMLCSSHFDKKYFRPTSKTISTIRLSQHAYPTIFLRNEDGTPMLENEKYPSLEENCTPTEGMRLPLSSTSQHSSEAENSTKETSDNDLPSSPPWRIRIIEYC